MTMKWHRCTGIEPDLGRKPCRRLTTHPDPVPSGCIPPEGTTGICPRCGAYTRKASR